MRRNREKPVESGYFASMSLESVRRFFLTHAPDIEVIVTQANSATVAEAAAAHGVAPAQIAKTLSHGEQQWLEIALLLVQNPSVILLDEPGAGMGEEDKRRTIALIHSLSEQHTLIVVEHDMEFIRALSAPLLMLHQGIVFRSGAFEELVRDDAVIDAYLGRRSHAG